MSNYQENFKEERKSRLRKGPHGVGDPDDKTLRSVEEVIIETNRKTLVKNEYCPKEIKAYEECVFNAGLLSAFYQCKDLKEAMGDCLEFWNDAEEVQQRAKREYLEERTLYRQTGISKENREAMERIRKIKEQEAAQKSSS